MANVETANVFTKEMIDEFRQLELANIADIYRMLGLNCVVQGLKPLVPESRICGAAVTMRQIPIQDRRLWETQETSITVLMQMATPGSVLVIDAGGRVDVSSGFGGGAAALAKRYQIEGVVVNGACRDSLAVIEADMPTFVVGTTSPTCHGIYRTTCVNSEPVQLGMGPSAISVGPGDLVLGDRDSILIVPKDRAEEVLALAKERQEVDAKGHALTAAGVARDDPRRKELLLRSKQLQGLPTTMDDPPAFRSLS